jgi:ATP-dependent helicase Lhr and Lhr-like helicase
MPADPPEHAQPAAFDLLAEGVRRQLYNMGWPSLRPIQVQAIRTYLQTHRHLLIMAETAGGKTEAAFLPVLSAISAQPTGSVRAMYVGPLKALINDQFGRLEELCTHLDMPVSRWHGDVSASLKAGLIREPRGVLLITPESLESLLINRTAQLQRLFGGLRAIVIDEVHAFLESERGLHLASLLSRLGRYRSGDQPPPRMLGLSATVGDVEVARRYLCPDHPETVDVITDDGSHKEILFRLHGYDPHAVLAGEGSGHGQDGDRSEIDIPELRQMRAIATDVVEHCRGHSNLIFANAKGDIELYADLANECCREAGLPESFLVHHGSLSKEVREDTELAMKSGSAPRTTICSSTLEMGIDIGSVRMIGQIGAPWSVASLKQRMGRSGRRDGEPRRLRLYVKCDGDEGGKDPLDALPLDLLQAVAISELMLTGWVEPPRPAQLDLSTLTHQIISSIAESGSAEAADLHGRLCRVGPFRAVAPAMFAGVLRALAAADVIEQGPDRRLLLGLQGEYIRSQRDFYAAFTARTEFTIIAPDRVLGTLPIDSVPKPDEHIVFAARRWRVVDVDPARFELHVVPAKRRQRPKFMGTLGNVHARIRDQMRLMLAEKSMPPYLDSTASAALKTAQDASGLHDLARRRLVPIGDRRTIWLTWTGTTAQQALVALLTDLGLDVTDRAIAIECALSPADLVTRLANADRLLDAPLRLAAHVFPKQVRKFDHLLNDALLDQSIAADRLDTSEARKVVVDTLGTR